MSAISAQGARILVVDDARQNLDAMSEMLEAEGYRVSTAADGHQALGLVSRDRPDAVLLDILMPGLDGIEVCRRIKSDERTRLTPVVLVTASSEARHRVAGAQAGADDFLSKPVDLAELRARLHSLVRLKRYTDELDSVAAIFVTMAQLIEARDTYTENHCQRLAAYATALGERLGLDRAQLTTLHRGALMHDIGKIGIPDAILLKPGRLNPAEAAIVRRHPIIGDELCATLRSLQSVRPIVRHHHERLDGSGYPDGLEGDAVPLLAQIVSIVDIYDALTTDRPYRRAFRLDRSMDELVEQGRRGYLRSDVVAEFLVLADNGVLSKTAGGALTASISDWGLESAR